MSRIAELKAQVRAQEAYGKWNTAAASNEIARLEDAARSPIERVIRKVSVTALIVAGGIIVYAPYVLYAIRLVVGD